MWPRSGASSAPVSVFWSPSPAATWLTTASLQQPPEGSVSAESGPPSAHSPLWLPPPLGSKLKPSLWPSALGPAPSPPCLAPVCCSHTSCSPGSRSVPNASLCPDRPLPLSIWPNHLRRACPACPICFLQLALGVLSCDHPSTQSLGYTGTRWTVFVSFVVLGTEPGPHMCQARADPWSLPRPPWTLQGAGVPGGGAEQGHSTEAAFCLFWGFVF